MADNVVEMTEKVKKGEDQGTARKVTFGKPYLFEGAEYTELDMSGLDKLTVKDAIEAQRELFAQQEVAGIMVSERATAFSRVIAARATGLPEEFFKLMPLGYARRVKNEVIAFLNEGGDEENHILTFASPVEYKGKKYDHVDLNKIAELTGMNESEAENRVSRAGFVVTENSFSYLYACIVASMATGLDEEFFTSLPLRELVSLKNAVNNSDFFE